jgi:glyoxylase-like metal-dependent hydrolase (beta-lactamase superfamily II)
LDEHHRTSLGLNCLLLQSEGKTILIETGVGDKGRKSWQASPLQEGNLLSDLAAHGFRPEDVDIVINTHLHADHCGWNPRYLPTGQAGPASENGAKGRSSPPPSLAPATSSSAASGRRPAIPTNAPAPLTWRRT